MTKKIKKLEKETTMYRSRWESSNKALLEMAEEVGSVSCAAGVGVCSYRVSGTFLYVLAVTDAASMRWIRASHPCVSKSKAPPALPRGGGELGHRSAVEAKRTNGIKEKEKQGGSMMHVVCMQSGPDHLILWLEM